MGLKLSVDEPEVEQEEVDEQFEEQKAEIVAECGVECRILFIGMFLDISELVSIGVDWFMA